MRKDGKVGVLLGYQYRLMASPGKIEQMSFPIMLTSFVDKRRSCFLSKSTPSFVYRLDHLGIFIDKNFIVHSFKKEELAVLFWLFIPYISRSLTFKETKRSWEYMDLSVGKKNGFSLNHQNGLLV